MSMATTLIPGNFAFTLKNNAANVLKDAKKLCAEASESRFIDLMEARGRVNSLTELCSKVEGQTRQEIDNLLEKTKNKLDLADKTIQHLLKNDQTSLDPRVEKIVRKMNLIGDGKMSIITMSKFLHWKEKLDLLAKQGNSNEVTNQVIENVRILEKELCKPGTEKKSWLIIDNSLIGQPMEKIAVNLQVVGFVDFLEQLFLDFGKSIDNLW